MVEEEQEKKYVLKALYFHSSAGDFNGIVALTETEHGNQKPERVLRDD